MHMNVLISCFIETKQHVMMSAVSIHKAIKEVIEFRTAEHTQTKILPISECQQGHVYGSSCYEPAVTFDSRPHRHLHNVLFMPSYIPKERQ
jgi:hypothetical protein